MLEWIYDAGNQNTTQEFTYIKEVISQINDSNELPEDIYPINKFKNNWPIKRERTLA